MRYYENFQELYDVLRHKIVAKELPVKEVPFEHDVPSADMSKAELMEIAEEKGISVPKKATKKDILNAIKGAK